MDDRNNNSSSSSNNDDNKIRTVNIANAVAYVFNTGATYLLGISGLFPTNAELSEKYQSIVTPAAYAFAIWSIIFLSQLIWTVCQLLPAYRTRDAVIDGVGYKYVFVCISQALWSLAFSLEEISLSLLAMVSILIPLVWIVARSKQVPVETTGLYFLLEFPFEIHAGWIWAATLVNFNVVLVAREEAVSVQELSGYISLAVVVAVSLYYIFISKKYVIPLVLSWASLAVYVELGSPKDPIAETFSDDTIQNIRLLSGGIAIVVTVVAVAKLLYGRFFQSKPEEDNPDAYQTI